MPVAARKERRETMIRIHDGRFTADIDENGAELKSLCIGRTEFMRCDPADPWQETAPVLFPICGGLKDDYFLYQGKKYPLPKHGFAKKRVFTGKKTAENEAVFTLLPREGDEKMYPWKYCFTAAFRLAEGSLTVTYTVESRDKEDMFFSLGAHEGYAMPEGLEAYTVEFDKEETAPVYSVTGSLLDGGKRPFLRNEKSFRPRADMFKPDALIFKDLVSRSVTLRGPFPFLLTPEPAFRPPWWAVTSSASGELRSKRTSAPAICSV